MAPKATDLDPATHEVSLQTAARDTAPPLVEVKAVYLGGNPHKSVPLRGTLRQERYGEQVRMEIVSSGLTPYDFTSVDALGHPHDPSRYIAPDHPKAHLRGKRFARVQHPDHALAFARMRDGNDQPEFEILGSPEHMRVLQVYADRKAVASRKASELYSLVTS